MDKLYYKELLDGFLKNFINHRMEELFESVVFIHADDDNALEQIKQGFSNECNVMIEDYMRKKYEVYPQGEYLYETIPENLVEDIVITGNELIIKLHNPFMCVYGSQIPDLWDLPAAFDDWLCNYIASLGTQVEYEYNLICSQDFGVSMSSWYKMGSNNPMCRYSYTLEKVKEEAKEILENDEYEDYWDLVEEFLNEIDSKNGD